MAARAAIAAMSAAGARATSPSRCARSRATRLGQAIIAIENGGLRAWGRVNDAGGATCAKRLISGYRHPLEP